MVEKKLGVVVDFGLVSFAYFSLSLRRLEIMLFYFAWGRLGEFCATHGDGVRPELI